MLSPTHGPRIADRFALGVAGGMTGPVARGVVGQIWRLETDRGSWAVKEWFEPPAVEELAEGVAFQEAAAAAGIPSPPTARAPDGPWLADRSSRRAPGERPPSRGPCPANRSSRRGPDER